jgi:2'-hydroxyisoflavone reductase
MAEGHSAPLTFKSYRPKPTGPAREVLVLGGTGFVGSHLAEGLIDRGHRVTVTSRGRAAAPVVPPGARHATTLPEGAFDAVYDLSSPGPEELAAALGSLKDRAARYVLLSTADVYGPGPHGEALIEEFRAEDGALDPEARRRRDAEDLLLAAKGPATHVVRPSMVYGPRESRPRFLAIFQRVLHDVPIVVPGSIDVPFHPIFVRDLADLLAKLLDAPAAASGEAFNAGGPEPVTIREVVFDAANLLGKSFEMKCLGLTAEEYQREADRLPGEFPLPCFRPMILNPEKTLDVLDLDAATPLPAGLFETWEWYKRERSEAVAAGVVDGAWERRMVDLMDSRRT